MTDITTIGASFQIMSGLILVAIAIAYVGSQIVEQMERRNDLLEAKLRSEGVPLSGLESE
ncbi:hypothetical protein P2W50_31225 [Pseudomonas protegens]|uniref:hypothetical protein n=1 Tax=Pseudomonas protegens TaxID=380021 RepID=UPI0023ED828F|nr:hypothetical protein [Pseudomonas protegens]MDF4211125.1 hypothetical protein [Pseudomonas protegens]